MKLLIIDKSKLVPLEDNPRKVKDKEGRAKLIKLIREHGFQNPLQVWREPSARPRDPFIILCGNHRFVAGIECGLDKFPCIEYKGSREKALARAISDNKSSEWTKWDDKKLAKMLAEITLDAGMLVDDLTGFDLSELDQLLAEQSTDKNSAPTKEDVSPAVKNNVPAITRRGDIWQMGTHRLLCGDAKSADDINKLMAGQAAAVVFTDPPYGMRFDTNFSAIGEAQKKRNKLTGDGLIQGRSGPVSKNYDEVVGDHEDYNPSHLFRDFGHCKEMFLWGADYYAERLPEKNKGSWLIWDKRAGIEDVNFSLSEFETCWSKKKHARKILHFRWFGMMGTEAPEEDIHHRVHPNQKPVKRFLRMLGEYSKRGDIIVDPFLGSGSTLIACENLGRICYGVEMVEKYCDVILGRWADYTGGDPVRNDGTTWSALCPSG